MIRSLYSHRHHIAISAGLLLCGACGSQASDTDAAMSADAVDAVAVDTMVADTVDRDTAPDVAVVDAVDRDEGSMSDAAPDGSVTDASAPDAGGATRLAYRMLAVHPQAMMQSTTLGRGLHDLAAFHGKIYAGFGDWNANTGPIAINPFDPATGTFASAALALVQTEALDRLRLISGNLYAPMTDPRPSNGGYARGVVSGSTERWTAVFPVNAVHVLDMCTLDGTDLWMAGAEVTSSTTSDGVLWRSTDGGTTWTEAHRGSGLRIGRFYFCAALGGSLYAAETPTAAVHRFDGTTWSRGPVLGTSTIAAPIQFLGRLVWVNGGVNHVQMFDGTTVSSAMDLPEEIRDIAIEGSTLYALGVNGRIDWTTDLVTWHGFPAAMPMTDVLSLAVLDGNFYVGGAASQIYLATPGP